MCFNSGKNNLYTEIIKQMSVTGFYLHFKVYILS